MFKGKLNKLRTYSMGIMLVGFAIMYIGIVLKDYPIIMSIIMVLGLILVVISASSYFWIGMLSSRAVLIKCPTCEKTTKMLGKNDECMFCGQKLTLDPNQATNQVNSK